MCNYHQFVEATRDGFPNQAGEPWLTWVIWYAWNHAPTTDMHGLIVALVAASAAAQTCPASLISDKTTTPLGHVREVPVAGEEYWYGAPER